MFLRRCAAGIAAAVCLSLCACSSGGRDRYAPTFSLAARDSAEFRQTDNGFLLQNDTVRLAVPQTGEGLGSIASPQTDETLLKQVFVTRMTDGDGETGVFTGAGAEVTRERYCTTLRRAEDLRLPCATDGEPLLSYSFENAADRAAFAALRNDVRMSEADGALCVTAGATARAQFGVRDLSVALPNEPTELSVTLRASGAGTMEVYFATDAAALSKATLLGSFSLTDTEDFVTLTLSADHPRWSGTLKTLLFRMTDAADETVEIRSVVLLSLPDTVIPAAAQTQITLYSDRAYFAQTVTDLVPADAELITLIPLAADTVLQIEESDDGVCARLIDGTVFGIVRPAEHGDLSLTRDENGYCLTLRFDRAIAARIYLEYTDSFDGFHAAAAEERSPLGEDAFVCDGLSFDGYRPETGEYVFTASQPQATLTLLPARNTVFARVLGADGWDLYDPNGARLPIVAETLLPLRAGESAQEFCLKAAQDQPLEDPSPFFAVDGLTEISRSATALNAVCRQQTSVYLPDGGEYLVTVTRTQIDDHCVFWETEYLFRRAVSVADVSRTLPLCAFSTEQGFDAYSYFNAEDESSSASAGDEDVCYLGSMPYLFLASDAETCAWLIPRASVTAGGLRTAANLCLRYRETEGDAPNRWDLYFDLGKTEFLRGDTLSVRVIQIPDADGSTAAALRTSSHLLPVQTGSAAETSFDVRGVSDTVILCIDGFDTYLPPRFFVDGEEYRGDYAVYPSADGYAFALRVPNGSKVTR